MDFIQTLYIDKSKDPFDDTFGWAKPKYHLMAWVLSFLQINKLYKKVELYANSKAAKLLIDTLELPYNNVILRHDNLKLAHENLWALPKVFTYSLQDKPFLHLDGDVFLFDYFSDSLLKSELIAQNLENATDYYISTQKELITYLTYFPKYVKTEFDSQIPIKAVNAGILGGNNIQFIKEYSSDAFEYINRNIANMCSINVDRFNVFFEQHLFYCLAKEKNITINFLFKDIIKDNEYEHLGSFHEVPCKKSYLHLLGQYKRDEYTCVQMAAKLRDLYPEYYYKIVSICNQNNNSLKNKFYFHEKLDGKNDFQNLHKKANESYSKGIIKSDLNIIELDCAAFQNENNDLSLLNRIFNIYKDSPINLIDMNRFEKDFQIFSKKLLAIIQKNTKISEYYLYGRDLKSTNWFCEIFANDFELPNKIISRCEELSIIESEFDWAGMINKYKRVGVKYYSNLELSQGHFFNLVIPEVSENKFSLFDIDEIDKLILDHLTIPKSVTTLLVDMQCYIEDEVIQNHLETYNNLIIALIKQLVVKKAIKSITQPIE